MQQLKTSFRPTGFTSLRVHQFTLKKGQLDGAVSTQGYVVQYYLEIENKVLA